MKRLRILTWNIHGNYLLYLSRAAHEFYLPVKPVKAEGYGGRGKSFPFGENVHDVPAEEVRNMEFDCILFQSRRNYDTDQFELLREDQLRLPRIYLEHNPPQGHPTDTLHCVQDPNVLLVHVTHFNDLMWNAGITPTRVIEHGVFLMEEARYRGEIEKGLVVINNLHKRGRRLGEDVFESIQREVPLDLVGMNTEELGGLGEIFPPALPLFMAHYRFFFNPIRYTSLGLAVIEAMMVGLPIIGLATTEMVTTIHNGVSGYLATRPENLIPIMQELLRNPVEAQRLGAGARRYALERFHIERFARDWDAVVREVTGNSAPRPISSEVAAGETREVRA